MRSGRTSLEWIDLESHNINDIQETCNMKYNDYFQIVMNCISRSRHILTSGHQTCLQPTAASRHWRKKLIIETSFKFWFHIKFYQKKESATFSDVWCNFPCSGENHLLPEMHMTWFQNIMADCTDKARHLLDFASGVMAISGATKPPQLLIRSGHYSLVMLWLWKTETDHLGTATFFTQLSQEQRSWNPDT